MLAQDKLGPVPSGEFYQGDHAKNNLPDCPERWADRECTKLQRKRTDQSFCVPKADIVAQGDDLSLNRYKEAVHNETEHRDPGEIIADLEKLEVDIERDLELQARFARRVEAVQVSRAFITLAMRSSIPCSRLCNRGRFLGGLTWRGACGQGFSRRPWEAEVHRLGGNDESFHR